MDILPTVSVDKQLTEGLLIGGGIARLRIIEIAAALILVFMRKLVVTLFYSLATSEVKDYINEHFPHFRKKR